MLLTITTTHKPATDLGFLLHKNPARLHELELPFGRAVMFYPEANPDRTTFALLLDIDAVGLVRGNSAGTGNGGLLDQYVNDRPYVASSFLSVALAKAMRSALGGKATERPELAITPIPLEARVQPLPVRGSEGLIERLFSPLGYKIDIERIALDETWPEWGASPYVALHLRATCLLRELLAHLYVLIPVLDRSKHYYVGAQELEKLLAKGEGWLSTHPERELITKRYLRFKPSLTRQAFSRLAADDPTSAEEIDTADAAPAMVVAPGAPPIEIIEPLPEPRKDAAEQELEAPIRLHDVRLDRVTARLKELGARRVVDLGCGSGKLLKRLLSDKQFTEVVGVDASTTSLDIAARRLKLDRLTERQRKRVVLFQGALTYRDSRIEGFDAIALVEVIEHLDPDRLASLERAVFEFAKPAAVILTTPNVEFNVRFDGLPAGAMRHADHRFEWTRAQFRDWAQRTARSYGYSVEFEDIGECDAELGSPSQMAVFELE